MGAFVFLSVCGDGETNAKQAWLLRKILWKMLLIAVFCNLLGTTVELRKMGHLQSLPNCPTNIANCYSFKFLYF